MGQSINLLIVFLISGLWHGASWTYVIWGGLHGIYLGLEIQVQRVWRSLPEKFQTIIPNWLLRLLQHSLVMILVSYAWVFFRATSVESAWLISSRLFSGWTLARLSNLVRSTFTNYELLITFAAIVVMAIVHQFQERGSVRAMLAPKSAALRWSLYIGILVCILIFGRIYEIPTDFIYFQF